MRCAICWVCEVEKVEMIDWEAPTGGYLMQGCFATATRAANSAVAWLG